MSHCVPLDDLGALSQCWKCLQDLLNSPASCPCMSLHLASPRPGCHRPVPGPLQSLNSEKNLQAQPAPLSIFFWSAKEVAADPLGLLQLREVTGEQKGKTSGCRWCSPLRHQGCQCQDSCQPPASSLQPAGGPQATFCRDLADLPLSVLLSVLFLFVNLFPALFPP